MARSPDVMIKDPTYKFVCLFATVGCPGDNEPSGEVKPEIRNLLKFFNDILIKSVCTILSVLIAA